MVRTLQDPSVRPNDFIFMEFNRFEVDHDGFGGVQPIRCAFDGRYKLTVNVMSTDELYDVQSDPGEMVNLIDSAEHKAVRNGLHDRLIQWMYETRDPLRGYYWERRAWRKEKPATRVGTGLYRRRDDDGFEPRVLDYFTGVEIETTVTKVADVR